MAVLALGLSGLGCPQDPPVSLPGPLVTEDHSDGGR